MKEALFYQKLAANKVRCQLCPHLCLIAEGWRGICGVRENQAGILYSLVYGKIAAAHVDPIEKKPLYHFLPGTASYSISTVGCNFRCDFCQNFGLSQPIEIEGEELAPQDIVREALALGCQSISYTYTEPTIYFEFAYDTARLAREKGLKNVFVTNGFTAEPPLRMIAPYLDAANVDLKSFQEEFYHKYCGGKLEPVLKALKLYKELNIWLEVTTLIIQGLNDSEAELLDIAKFIKNELGEGVPWHVSAFFPTYKMTDRPRTPAATVYKAREIGLKAGLKYVYTGNLPL